MLLDHLDTLGCLGTLAEFDPRHARMCANSIDAGTGLRSKSERARQREDATSWQRKWGAEIGMYCTPREVHRDDYQTVLGI